MKRQLLIGSVAGELGLNPKTIRYYEDVGLLPEADRTSSGYRVYSPEVINRLKFIKQAQRLGFRLNEIKDILLLKESGTRPCTHVRRLTIDKIKELEELIRESSALRDNLKTLLRRWPHKSGKEATICPHIEAAVPTNIGTKKKARRKRER
ncbi:MAG: heavy metal-responsive transcriptional regulator [Candidatus Brocadiales bacterium]|nr:heavy metal-responsive transcriptional regulator [Candidatus Bathyanammoxibius amoris]